MLILFITGCHEEKWVQKCVENFAFHEYEIFLYFPSYRIHPNESAEAEITNPIMVILRRDSVKYVIRIYKNTYQEFLIISDEGMEKRIVPMI